MGADGADIGAYRSACPGASCLPAAFGLLTGLQTLQKYWSGIKEFPTSCGSKGLAEVRTRQCYHELPGAPSVVLAPHAYSDMASDQQFTAIGEGKYAYVS